MRRVMLDCNAVDPLADLPDAAGTIALAVAEGRLELLVTRTVDDEISAVPDAARRALLRAVVGLARTVPEGGFIVGRTALGEGRLPERATFDKLRSGRGRNTNDAIIGAAGYYEGCALVTNDRRLTREATAVGVKVITPEQLLAEIGYRVSAT